MIRIDLTKKEFEKGKGIAMKNAKTLNIFFAHTPDYKTELEYAPGVNRNKKIVDNSASINLTHPSDIYIKGYTKCQLSIIVEDRKGKDIIEMEIPTVESYSYCSSRDNFSRTIGRKVSLERALKLSGFSKEVRGYIWMEYNKTNLKINN